MQRLRRRVVWYQTEETMELIARAGTCMDTDEILSNVLDVVENGDTLVLTWGDGDAWMSIGTESVTDAFITNTLYPALVSVCQGCFDLWKASPPNLDEDVLERI